MNKVQLSNQFIIFYNFYVIALYFNICNNSYRDASREHTKGITEQNWDGSVK